VTRRSFAVAWLAAAALSALPAAAQSISRGESIYGSICRACHGFPPSGGPERAEGNPAVIQGAINGRVPAMGFLREVLTPGDVADVAAYLASLLAPPQPAVPAFDYTDLWWNPAESGWGLNLIQHASNVIFGVMYTYEPPRRATWFVLPGGTWASPTTFGGPLYRVTGPAFNAPAFDPAAVNVRPVGAATLTFTDRDNGTFAFSVDGVAVTKTITRQPF
jgi:cytochrome c553